MFNKVVQTEKSMKEVRQPITGDVYKVMKSISSC